MFDLILLGTALAAGLPEPATLLELADAPRRGFLHGTLRVRVTVEQPEGAAQTGEFDVLLGDEDQQLVLFRDKQNKGRKFLMVGDKSWLIVPGSKNPIAVTANQRLFGASSFADIARVRLAADYSGTLRPEMEACGDAGQTCYVAEVSATRKSAPYASGTLWIEGSGLLRRAVYRLASGKAAKEIVYRYKDNNGTPEPAGLTLTDLLLPDKTGKTTLDYIDHRHTEHPASIFDPRQQTSP